MDLGIHDRLALVTGADSGIGWHTARLLLREEATVVLSDQHQDTLDTAAERLRAEVGEELAARVHAFAADVTDVDQLVRLHRRVADLGIVDIVVQSSGVTGAQGQFHEIDDAGWTNAL